MHGNIQKKGSISIEGTYHDSEWDRFADAANTNEEWKDIRRYADWGKATKTHGGLLRSILKESFHYGNRQRRGWLSICVVLSTIGYLPLFIPGVDLIIKVAMSMLSFIGE
jgi:hypothetical protein